MTNKAVKHPCIGCIYFKTCGTSGRTQRCEGRVTKSDKEKKYESRHIQYN